MKKATNPNAVGVDAFFREIFPGDVVRDLDGNHYTVDKFGTCKPLAGGGIKHLSDLKEPSVVGAVAPPFAEGADGKVGPARAPAETRETPAETPAPEKKKRGGSRGPKTAATRDLMSERRNKSGTVQIYNLIRDQGLPFDGRAARKILEQAGINTFADGAGRGCIARGDFARAQEILQKAEPPKVEIQVQAPGPDPAPLTEAPEMVFTREDALKLLDDADLAEELRRRGYTVTATKHVEL